MDDRVAPAFGELLKRFRLAAGVSQETLAERASLSVEAISALERGTRLAPHKETVDLLARALELSAPERAQLDAAAPRRRSPLHSATLGGARARLPEFPTTFVGRERVVAEVAERLAAARLLTLTGPPGVGKTRLAVRVASQAAASFPDGVWFVPLASIADPELVLPTIAQTLGLQDARRESVADRLQDHLGEKRALLVLDNFEQVLPAAASVGALLAECRRMAALVTSRAALRLAGEQVVDVPPLATPPRHGEAPVAAVAGYEAVRLFAERARAVRSDFALTEQNAAAVSELCRRLDGLPLAIELAAAWARLFSPQALLARLEADRLGALPLLTRGARDVPERHRTLQAAIAWSHDLLGPAERVVFRRLGVFVGGCTLGAAEAVCAGVGEVEGGVLGGVAALVDASLLRAEEQPDDESRLAMLETIRDYALDQLTQSGEADAARQAHAAHFVALAERAHAARTHPDHALWLDRLERDLDNVRAALTWSAEGGDDATALRLAAAMMRFWTTRGSIAEGRAWLARLLARIPAAGASRAATALRANALGAAGVLADHQGDGAAARDLWDACLAIRRELGDIRGMAEALNGFGYASLLLGDHDRATIALEESLALSHAHQHAAMFPYRALHFLGNVAAARGDYEGAASRHEQALALARVQGDSLSVAWVLRSLADVARRRGEHGRAAALLEESLSLSRDLRDHFGIAEALRLQGDVAAERGDQDAARALFREALLLQRRVANRGEIARCLAGLAALAAERPGRAARLAAAAAELQDAASAGPPADAHESACSCVPTGAVTGPDPDAATGARGRVLRIEEAIAIALADDSRP